MQLFVWRDYSATANGWVEHRRQEVTRRPGENSWGFFLRAVEGPAADTAVLTGTVEFWASTVKVQTIQVCGNIGPNNQIQPVLFSGGMLREIPPPPETSGLPLAMEANSTDPRTLTLWIPGGTADVLADVILYPIPQGITKVVFVSRSEEQNGSGLPQDVILAAVLA